jgi:prepilin-type N-terminal cleavage/methylation domain-containing protein
MTAVRARRLSESSGSGESGSSIVWGIPCPIRGRLKAVSRSADPWSEVIRLRMARIWRNRPGLAGEAGYTMIELLVVMIIMGLVLLGLTTSFAAGLTAETGATRRSQAQANARIALNRMRTDIHCASGAPAPQENPYGGFTLTLTESPNACPLVTTSSAGVQWCTIPVAGSTTQWQLFRFLGTVLTDCNSSSASAFMVDFVSEPAAGWPSNSATSPAPADWDGNLWPTAPACPAGNLPTVAVDLNVNLDPVGHPSERYELTDAIALRNALRCT